MKDQGSTGEGLYHPDTPADLPREARPMPPRTPLRPSPFAGKGGEG